jgi:uncharacterized membrane protein YbhN (UPF0104 family)
VLREADWRWVIAALALSAATYAGATEQLIGFVPAAGQARPGHRRHAAAEFVHIFCLAAGVAAFSRSVPIARTGVVYLTGSAIGSIVPTPGSIGAVEAALTAGLTAAGVPGAAAASALLLFRRVTFWLPIPFGWAALKYLEREQAL